MKPYLAILSARFRMLLQYRVAAVAGIVTQVFWGIIRMMIFMAFYRSSSAPQPMELKDVITYVWLGQAFLTLLPWNVDQEIRRMIRDGTVAYELLRPVDLYNYWYTRAIAARTAPAAMRTIPIFVFGMLWFGMRPPVSWEATIAWVVATFGAVLLSGAISAVLNISLMWTIASEGMNRLIPAMVMIFSGLIIPIPLFPDWAQTVIHLLPFAGLGDTPFRLYTGNIPPEGVFGVVLHQLIWTGILIMIGKMALARGTKTLVIQGG
jgi:ABC-2 type transport system permease protein